MERICDRCKKKTISTIMSWFTTEIICGDCSTIESDIRNALPDKGFEFEGCGFIPEIDRREKNPSEELDYE